MASRTLVVDPHHWLDANGDLPASGRIRARALRVAQFIEYGGPMPQGTARETLVPCKRRPGGKPCPGLIWVSKELDDAIVAFCMGCRGEEMHIHEWQDTQWADGPMEPINPLTGAPLTDEPETDAGDALRRALQLLGSSLTSEQVVARIANAKNPSDVLRAVMESAKRPPPTSIVEQVLPLLMEAWNNTPRAELGGRSPSQMQGATSGSQTNSVGAARDASPSVVKVGRNDPCPCGSGRKHKKCCLSRTLN